jgi:hypothetical protein
MPRADRVSESDGPSFNAKLGCSTFAHQLSLDSLALAVFKSNHHGFSRLNLSILRLSTSHRERTGRLIHVEVKVGSDWTSILWLLSKPAELQGMSHRPLVSLCNRTKRLIGSNAFQALRTSSYSSGNSHESPSRSQNKIVNSYNSLV